MGEKSKRNAPIPKVELENFNFSPAGPMGWSISEYEKMLNEEQLENISTTNINFRSKINLEGKQLVELGMDESKLDKDNRANKNKDEESSSETIYRKKEELDLEDVEPLENSGELELDQYQERDPETELEIVSDTESEIETELESEIEPEPEPEPEPEEPKNKVTIIIKEGSLKKPWFP